MPASRLAAEGTARRRGASKKLTSLSRGPVAKESDGEETDVQARQDKTFAVVGVGASAGGLEAFTQLLQNLSPHTGMAFVLVQHLDPQHESVLTQLLARATSMPVCEVTNDLRVEANHVYVIPPNSNLTIVGGVLKLGPRQDGHKSHHPIDSFFESLATDRRERAIGAVLSGTATDGTVGLEAVKAEGGITFAQDESARYDSMPRSAVAAGCVDFVLSPENIAKELARIAKHPHVAGHALPSGLEREAGQRSSAEALLASGGAGSAQAREEAEAAPGKSVESGFKKILLLLRNHSGVDFSLYKPTTILRRITRRMVLNKQDTLEGYAHVLRSNAAELDALFSDALISVTSFFRNPDAFDVLKRKVFPKLLHQRGDEPLRVWVLGCSTGQEAYSITMAFEEAAERVPRARKLQMFATDLSDALLDKARQGLYAKTVAQDVSPERLRRFFVEEEGGYRVIKPLREMVVFARQNLISDPPFSRMDLICCRNLLIYLEPGLQKTAIPTFHYALKPGGFLFLGASESIGGFTDLFEPADKRHKIYSKKAAPTPAFHLPVKKDRAERPSTGQPRQAATPLQMGRAQGEPESLRAELSAQREADRVTVGQFAPPGVLINAELQILQFRGPTSAYLQPPTGKASFDVLKMAREGLMLPLRAAINRAKKENKTARRENEQVQHNGKTRLVNVEVIPLKNLREPCFLILFEDAARAGRIVPKAPSDEQLRDQMGTPRPASRRGESHRVGELERELSETRDYLQSIEQQHEAASEELQASNEEVQSANEELQSVNEELETSKEELESANEELTTVNEEMAHRNAELNRLNADLNNLQTSTKLPIVLIGRDLAIRRFSMHAREIFNLLATDVGRPLGSVRHNLVVPTGRAAPSVRRTADNGQERMEDTTPFPLEDFARDVIDTVREQEREVRDKEGRWYSLRTRPYMTLDNKIDGAVLVLMDIDDLKRSQREMKAARDYAEAIIRTARHPMVVLGADLRVNKANEAFYKTFRTTPDQTEGSLIFAVSEGAWRTPQLRTLLEDILPRNSFFNDFEATHDFPNIGRRTMLLNARRLDLDDGSPQMVLLTIEDVTERQRADAAIASLAAIVNSSDDAIIGKDLDGVITSWNKGAERLFGYTAQEAVGQSVTMLMTPDRQHEEAEMLAYLLRGERVVHFETARVHKDGSVLEVSLTVSPIKDSTGRVIGASKIARDITDRKQAEAERTKLLVSEKAARAEAEAANRVKDEFLAMVSHELRTPLTAVLGYSRLLCSGNTLDEKTRALGLEAIQRNAKMLGQLIEDLLDISRILSDKLRLDVRPVDLPAAVRVAVEEVHPMAQAKAIDLRLEIDDGTGFIQGDKVRLQQIFGNLLLNAIKFTPEGGRVEVRLEGSGPFARFSITDTGVGIAPEFLPQVFERFRQFENSGTRSHEGLGLGLAIVRRLVELHGGTVRAESPGLGKGATFTVDLPAPAVIQGPESGAEEASEAAGLAHAPRLDGVCALVVDDRLDSRDLIALVLRQCGAEVVVAESAEAALSEMRRAKPDVLVADIAMPGEDGYDLIRKVRALKPAEGGLVPALALTAYASVEDRTRALAAGYQMHLAKPVEPAKLASAVGSLVR